MGVKRPSSRFNVEDLRQIEGRNPVREALRAGAPIVELFIENDIKSDDRLQEIRALAISAKLKVNKVFSSTLRKMSKTAGQHQGVIARAEWPEEANIRVLTEAILERKEVPFFLIVSDALYEHNLGAVIRTAESAGVHAIIINKRGLKLTPVVSKTATGAGEYIPLIHENLFSVMDYFKRVGVRIYGLREGNSKRMYKTDMTKPVALVMGVEDTGITETLAKHIDEFISIPMLGHIESLNMSVAAALVMYEVVRQRRYNQDTVN